MDAKMSLPSGETVHLTGWTAPDPLRKGKKLARVVIEESFLYNVNRDKIMVWVWRNLGKTVE